MLDDNLYELSETSNRNLLVYETVGTAYFAKGLYPWAETVRVRCVGGGGGAGGTATQTLANSAHTAGGGGGGYAEAVIPVASLGATTTILVGDGGGAGATGLNNGGSGGTSQFGSNADSAATIFCQANGGSGGEGADNNAGARHYNGGLGGSASAGDLMISGGDGIPSNNSATGAPPLGWGGVSALGFGGQQTRSGTNNSVAGNIYGGGAKGCYTIGPPLGGAAGAQGIVIVEVFG